MGISGVSSDMREVIAEMKGGNKKAQYAFDVFTYRIKKYIGAYIAAMGGADAIVFTGGIGENSPDVRKACCNNLEFLGIEFDDAGNISPEKEKPIHSVTSRVKIYVVPTNEELMIALDTAAICSATKPA